MAKNTVKDLHKQSAIQQKSGVAEFIFLFPEIFASNEISPL